MSPLTQRLKQRRRPQGGRKAGWKDWKRDAGRRKGWKGCRKGLWKLGPRGGRKGWRRAAGRAGKGLARALPTIPAALSALPVALPGDRNPTNPKIKPIVFIEKSTFQPEDPIPKVPQSSCTFGRVRAHFRDILIFVYLFGQDTNHENHEIHAF